MQAVNQFLQQPDGPGGDICSRAVQSGWPDAEGSFLNGLDGRTGAPSRFGAIWAGFTGECVEASFLTFLRVVADCADMPCDGWVRGESAAGKESVRVRTVKEICVVEFKGLVDMRNQISSNCIGA